eukprot:SAG31_NODE_208_length_20313_cov_6.143119_16_plen_76_part_00
MLAINLSEEEQEKIEVSFNELGIRAAGHPVHAIDAWTGEPVHSDVVAVGQYGLAFKGIRRHDSVFLVLSIKYEAS